MIVQFLVIFTCIIKVETTSIKPQKPLQKHFYLRIEVYIDLDKLFILKEFQWRLLKRNQRLFLMKIFLLF